MSIDPTLILLLLRPVILPAGPPGHPFPSTPPAMAGTPDTRPASLARNHVLTTAPPDVPVAATSPRPPLPALLDDAQARRRADRPDGDHPDAARPPPPAVPATARPWRWPVRPPGTVIRPFDPPAHPWEAGHRGVDLAARPGDPVYAAGGGRVSYAGDLAGRGVVVIVHGVFRTTYVPVHASVRAGRQVSAGDRVGTLEETVGHCGQRECLHWGLIQGDRYLDPLLLLGIARVRLLPWWEEEAGTPPGA